MPATSFQAVLYPNPPLGRWGQTALVVGVAIVSSVVGLGFALAGAWPVTGFLGLDVLLVWLAVRTCARSAHRAEVITLDETGLCVRRLGCGRHSGEWRFEPYWVRVDVEEPRRPDSPLVLRSHGRVLTIGRFLTLDERLDLARALDRALATHR